MLLRLTSSCDPLESPPHQPLRYMMDPVLVDMLPAQLH